MRTPSTSKTTALIISFLYHKSRPHGVAARVTVLGLSLRRNVDFLLLLRSFLRLAFSVANERMRRFVCFGWDSWLDDFSGFQITFHHRFSFGYLINLPPFRWSTCLVIYSQRRDERKSVRLTNSSTVPGLPSGIR